MHKTLPPVLCALAALGAAALPLSPRAEGAAPTTIGTAEPVLLELFTSQGCSSCPPADTLAARLDQENGLIVVSRPVTYWDRLGWKDTLASEANTALQRQYAQRGLAGRNGVYTPQLVLDGAIGVVGSQEPAVREGVNAARRGDTAAIRHRRNAQGDYVIGLGGETRSPAELALIAVASRADVAIARGENSGRKITYVNVLRDERIVARWNGGARKVTLSASALKTPGADRYALVLRRPDGGEVLAASWLD